MEAKQDNEKLKAMLKCTGSLFLIISPCILYFATATRWLCNNGGMSLVVLTVAFFVLMVAFMLLTNLKYPGISISTNHGFNSGNCDGIRLNERGTKKGVEALSSVSDIPPVNSLEIVTNGQVVTVKYCHTCGIIRPPRSVHCNVCGDCIDRFDHHCPWVGTCIGSANHKYFILFLISLLIMEILFIVGSSWMVNHFFLEAKNDLKLANSTKIFVHTMNNAGGPAVVIGFSSFTILFSGSLVVFHIYSGIFNKTTYEQIKRTYSEISNPWSSGVLRNLKQMYTSQALPISG